MSLMSHSKASRSLRGDVTKKASPRDTPRMRRALVLTVLLFGGAFCRSAAVDEPPPSGEDDNGTVPGTPVSPRRVDFNGDGKSDVLVSSGDPAFLRRILLVAGGTSFTIPCVGQTNGSCGL